MSTLGRNPRPFHFLTYHLEASMQNKKMGHAALVIALIGAGLLAPAIAHEQTSAEAAIDYRTSVMTVFRWNIKPMGDMMKGDIPFDGPAFARHAKDLAAAASVDLMSGFPEESEEGDTDAKPEVWMEWEDFQKKFKDLQEQSAKLAEVAAGGGRGVITDQFNATAETCKACHKKFKE